MKGSGQKPSAFSRTTHIYIGNSWKTFQNPPTHLNCILQLNSFPYKWRVSLTFGMGLFRESNNGSLQENNVKILLGFYGKMG